MSLLLKTLKAFPRGCTIDELYVLLDSDYNSIKRRSIQVELDELVQNGEARKGRDGRWRPIILPTFNVRDPNASSTTSTNSVRGDESAVPSSLTAAFASFRRIPLEQSTDDKIDEEERPDPNALLRYWRTALRADPRGAIEQTDDRHGSSWHLITGAGPVYPDDGEGRLLSIELDTLNPEFRQALQKRDDNENAFAIGWPVAVGRKSGMPAVWPVGLFAAAWKRTDTHLEIRIEADDILVNPKWIQGADLIGWGKKDLEEVFASFDSVGLRSKDFITRLREAAAGQIRGRITGEGLQTQIDPRAPGIYDITAIFLPLDSSFTSGAVRDLDAIASWPQERLARTALAPLLGLVPDIEIPVMHDINLGQINAEQLQAVKNACSSPLSVVTGPPGTGKSQAIMSMAASVIMAGGKVLVASKNHQALDAIEDRLGSFAPSIPFLVRTLDPTKEIDRSLSDVLTELISTNTGTYSEPDEIKRDEMNALSENRSAVLAAIDMSSTIECQIASLLERIQHRQKKAGNKDGGKSKTSVLQDSFLLRIWFWVLQLFTPRNQNSSLETSDDTVQRAGAPLYILQTKLRELRQKRRSIDKSGDPVELSNKIAKIAGEYLLDYLAARTAVDGKTRINMADIKDNWEFSSPNQSLPSDLAATVIAHRPLWLASILGTPKRIPLDDGLFDLVIFDEASQCDIASALPLFARAKRAVVVGDDRQLSFIAQLGRAQDRNLMQAQGLPVSRMGRFSQSMRSLFDFALRVSDVPMVLLRQQYRSAGPIVDYISSEYYDGKLITAYDPTTMVIPEYQKPGLAWTHVDSPLISENGKVNMNEVKSIVEHLKMLLIEQGYSGTIGVIAPFRVQVHALEQHINAEIPLQKLEGAELRVATVDGFQGQERDVILFSPCMGASSASTAITFVQKEHRRINVAISRARAVAHIFGDLNFARSGKIRSLARLAAAATEPRQRTGEGVFDSNWERRVYHALKEHGLEPTPQYEIAGRRLDFALFGPNNIKLDLEVDGRRWHQDAEGRRKISDYWRDHQLKSLGWRVRRFWVDELAQDMENCIELIKQDLT